MKKVVLIAGTINHHQDTGDTRYVHLDANPRNIYDAELDMMLAPDVVANLSENLPMFADAAFDEIRCHHVLEHMTWEQAKNAMHSMARVLKPNGLLDVETPDFSRIADAWVKGIYSHKELQQWIYGEDLNGDYDGHRQALDATALRKLIEEAGLKVIEVPDTGLACRFIARKPL
jgi:predicted SAM-dependent methyltransferase